MIIITIIIIIIIYKYMKYIHYYIEDTVSQIRSICINMIVPIVWQREIRKRF